MSQNIDTEKKYTSESLLCKGEKNDCVVRSFASSFNIPYEKAHQYVEDVFNRKPKQGAERVVTIIDNSPKILGHKVEALGETFKYEFKVGYYSGRRLFNGSNKNNRRISYTTGSFIKAFPKGVFLIIVSGHMFTIKDGIIFGNIADSRQLRSRIQNVYRITK